MDKLRNSVESTIRHLSSKYELTQEEISSLDKYNLLNILYNERNKFNKRKLPHLIGCRDYFNDTFVGLKHETENPVIVLTNSSNYDSNSNFGSQLTSSDRFDEASISNVSSKTNSSGNKEKQPEEPTTTIESDYKPAEMTANRSLFDDGDEEEDIFSDTKIKQNAPSFVKVLPDVSPSGDNGNRFVSSKPNLFDLTPEDDLFEKTPNEANQNGKQQQQTASQNEPVNPQRQQTAKNTSNSIFGSDSEDEDTDIFNIRRKPEAKAAQYTSLFSSSDEDDDLFKDLKIKSASKSSSSKIPSGKMEQPKTNIMANLISELNVSLQSKQQDGLESQVNSTPVPDESSDSDDDFFASKPKVSNKDLQNDSSSSSKVTTEMAKVQPSKSSNISKSSLFLDDTSDSDDDFFNSKPITNKVSSEDQPQDIDESGESPSVKPSNISKDLLSKIAKSLPVRTEMTDSDSGDDIFSPEPTQATLSEQQNISVDEMPNAEPGNVSNENSQKTNDPTVQNVPSKVKPAQNSVSNEFSDILKHKVSLNANRKRKPPTRSRKVPQNDADLFESIVEDVSHMEEVNENENNQIEKAHFDEIDQADEVVEVNSSSAEAKHSTSKPFSYFSSSDDSDSDIFKSAKLPTVKERSDSTNQPSTPSSKSASTPVVTKSQPGQLFDSSDSDDDIFKSTFNKSSTIVETKETKPNDQPKAANVPKATTQLFPFSDSDDEDFQPPPKPKPRTQLNKTVKSIFDDDSDDGKVLAFPEHHSNQLVCFCRSVQVLRINVYLQLFLY